MIIEIADQEALADELDQRIAEWLRALIQRSSAVRSRRSSLSHRDDRALRLARDYPGDRPERNVGLDELAAAAGIGKFRSSASSASAPAYHRTRCRSPTACAKPAACSKPTTRSPTSPPPPASPTRATFTAASSAASG
jgi:hypothetical protein